MVQISYPSAVSQQPNKPQDPKYLDSGTKRRIESGCIPPYLYNNTDNMIYLIEDLILKVASKFDQVIQEDKIIKVNKILYVGLTRKN